MILIKNTTIVTQDAKRRIIEKGAILINKDKIVFVGETKKLPKEYLSKVKQVIDGRAKVVLPGLINTHSHLAMTLLRGYADDLPLEEWWMEHVYPAESKFGRDEVYWGSLLAMVEMIKTGTTCFTDFYYYPDEVAKAAKKINIRGFLGCGILSVPTFYFKDSTEALAKAQKIIDDFKDDNLIKVSLAPHMFQTTSPKTYRKAKRMAEKHNLLLQTHTSESRQENKYCQDKYKKRPVEILQKNDVLDNRTILAHCCWLNKKDIKILSKNKVSVAHCPTANMKLADGIMPLMELIKQGVNVSLGTDGPCSNNNLDMFEEMKMAALIHKISHLDPTAANSQTVLDMATINGAKAFGLEQEIGSIELNKKADIITLDFNQAHLAPSHNIVSHLVYSARGSDVETVIINGKVVMENRQVKRVNEKALLKKIEKIAHFNLK